VFSFDWYLALVVTIALSPFTGSHQPGLEPGQGPVRDPLFRCRLSPVESLYHRRLDLPELLVQRQLGMPAHL
jgi:hypothetical protein